jgi:uncharacterized protein YprB with RNaseH-like and TPR domain
MLFKMPKGAKVLTHTFLHIPGIGHRTERGLWSSDILSWEDFLQSRTIPFSRLRAPAVRRHLEISLQHLEDQSPQYFNNLLPAGELWRLFDDFRDTAVYLDIETTGLNHWGSHITTIALYDGKSIAHYVYGDNLHDFAENISRYSTIITYNGKCFDIPFLKQHLGISFNHAHIDLRYVLGSLGLTGGLKGCERKLGLDRGDLDGIDGFFAVLLWQDYLKNRDSRTLETLLAYNIQDVITLETLMTIAYNYKLNSTPFSESRRVPFPSPPSNPFKVDRATVERIRAENGLYGWI